jgi:O-antigen/teichoic acid export membrane protein
MPLFAIAEAAATSLFAEGSRGEEVLAFNVVRGFKLTAFLLLPAVVVMLVGGSKLLLIFGGNYSQETTNLLRILVIATIPDAIIEIYLGTARVQRSLWALVLIPAAMGIVTIGLGSLLAPFVGITGPAIAWLAIQSAIALVVLPGMVRMVRSSHNAGIDMRAKPMEVPSSGTID